MNVGFVGAGAAGSALARSLAAAGIPVLAVASLYHADAQRLADRIPGCRAVESAQDVVDGTEIVFLTVPDGAIRAVCESLVWRPGVAAVHCSGALSLDVLDAAAGAGALVGGCHPVQALTGSESDADRLRGCAFGIEAAEPLRGTLCEMVERVGGRPLVLSAGQKALYHLSAAIISNYVVTLAAVAANLWGMFGMERGEALNALLPLLKGTVANLEGRGLPGALTGPIARGDAVTVSRHLAVLGESRPDLVPLYRELGKETVRLARERPGADASGLDAIEAMLSPSDEESRRGDNRR